MKLLSTLWILAISFSSCSKEESTKPPANNTIVLNTAKDYNSLINEFDEQLLLQSVEQPNDSGALGRNKNGYFHVRFQINMSKLSDLAVRSQRTDALQAFLRNLEYSFLYQEANGVFQLIPPQDLINDPDIPPANAGDRVSAAAFFGYSLGLSLTTLENSDWYSNQLETHQIRQQIQGFDSNIESTLTYLIHNKDILYQVDQSAPNRLLFNAIAFYSLGVYLENDEAKEIGVDFMQTALELIDETSGYFIEGGGWDSSYNGVALKLGLELFSLLSASEFKEMLGLKLVRAMDWQISKILPSGEISTEGNTRVFPGGESFLGNEKTIDVEKTIRALFYFSFLTENSLYEDIAMKVLNYYN